MPSVVVTRYMPINKVLDRNWLKTSLRTVCHNYMGGCNSSRLLSLQKNDNIDVKIDAADFLQNSFSKFILFKAGDCWTMAHTNQNDKPWSLS